MESDRLHLSWDTWQNQKELIRIIDALEQHFATCRFCVRIALNKRQSRDQAELSFYLEGGAEDKKICTIRHLLGSYLSMQNILATIGAGLRRQE